LVTTAFLLIYFILGSYLDRVKLNVPDEFDMHMILEFPLSITPKPIDSGFIYLEAGSVVTQPQRVNRAKLQDWLRDAFHKVFRSKPTLTTTGGRIYKLSYTLEGYGCAHTILATSGSRSISFDLVPAPLLQQFQQLFFISKIAGILPQDLEKFRSRNLLEKSRSGMIYMLCTLVVYVVLYNILIYSFGEEDRSLKASQSQ